MNLTKLIKDFQPNDALVQTPYIIAEAGVNHEGSMDLAKRLIEEAKEGGAHAIKFQTYKAETLASKNSPAYWDLNEEPTTSQYQLFKKHDKFWKKEFVALKKHCDAMDIEFLSTPFDVTSADFLDDLMPVFKISSSDLTNFPFIEHMCRKGKPIILSTGASEIWEVYEVVSLIESYNVPLSLLHCILNYPTLDKNANLGMIIDLKKKFPNYLIGYSDHTLPKDMQVMITATLLGAKIIEKHFSHDKTLPGNDHYHAMDKEDLKHFWKRWASVEATVGSQTKFALKSEAISQENARRSLVATEFIPEGTKITRQHLTWKRPGSGVSPRYYQKVLNKNAKKDITKDEVIQWNMLN